MKLSKRVSLFLLIGVAVFAFSEASEGVHVYPPVPGLEPSPHYSFKVRIQGSNKWIDAFAFVTTCKSDGVTNGVTANAYYWRLDKWSNTYINFEMASHNRVEIEISKVNGEPITRAVARPSHSVNRCKVIDGKAYVSLDHPALFTVDIDGQMDQQDTGRIDMKGWDDKSFYQGPPIHTLTIFANPFIEDKPSTDDPRVFCVEPGQVPPTEGDWEVLYFLPGVHEIGRCFRVHAEKSYYIPGDAIVHGTMNNEKMSNDGHHIRIFGHGTLSGERYPHPDCDTPPSPDYWKYKPIDIHGARNTTVEGITLTDSAMHSLMLINQYQPEQPNEVCWVKIFTWRRNGDGINPFGNTLIEDCFIRTQDDCVYVNGLGIRRVVFWTDANGSAFVLTPIGNMHKSLTERKIIVEDCDVIYNRSIFNTHKGGRVFNLRGAGHKAGGENIIFRNIRVTDPRPTRSSFGILSAAPWQKHPDYEQARGAGEIRNILFQNIDITAYSIMGDPKTLWGTETAPLRGFIFDNVMIDGELVEDISVFNQNEYVSDMRFMDSSSED